MGWIPEDIIAQVLDRADIVEIVGSYLPLKKAGRNFKALSPFTNEKTASFVVSPDKQIYHCFSSGKGGNVLSFIMHQEHLTFPEAVKFLADRVGVVVPEASFSQDGSGSLRQSIYEVNELAVKFYQQVLLTSREPLVEEAREYLKRRGISLEMVHTFQLGCAPDSWDSLLKHLREKKISLKLMEQAGLIMKRSSGDGYYDRFRGRIVFPIFDYRGRCVAFGARTLKNEDAKYINSSDTPVYTKGNHLYGFSWARQAIGEKDYVVVVEGYLDCLTPFQNGLQNIVASLGTALTVDQIRLIRRFTRNVVMLFDTDKAGLNAIMRSLDPLLEEEMRIKIAVLEEGSDPDSFVRDYGVAALQQRVDRAVSFFEFQWMVLSRQFDPMTVEGRADISQRIVPVLKKIKDEVLKAGYVKELASKLAVPERAVWQELEKNNPGHLDVKKATSAPKKGRENNVPPAEALLLQIVLERPSYLSRVKKELSVEDVTHPWVSEILTRLFNSKEESSIDIAQLIASIEDETLQQYVTSLAAEELAIENMDKGLQDCVVRIQTKNLRQHKNRLREQMQIARVSGDENNYQKLLSEYNQLITKR